MKKIIRIAALLGFAILAACGDEKPSGQTPSPAASSPTVAQALAEQVVYVPDLRNGPTFANAVDVWRYDVAADTVTRVTTDGTRHRESLPRFHGPKITFVEDGKKLVELDPATGTRTTAVSTAGQILAYAWHGAEVAYIDVNFNGDSIHYLRARDTATGRTETLTNLGKPPGRGTGSDDTVSLAWSKDGDRILINDTHLDKDPTVRIVRRSDASDAITPIKQATNAMWSTDERSIYVRLVPGPNASDAKWERLELATQTREPLALDPGAHHATLSPDGKHLAAVVFDRAEDAHVEVLDLAAGTKKSIATDAVDPLWLSNDSFAATRIVECQAGADECPDVNYRGVGASLYRLDGSMKTLKLVSTLWNGVGGIGADVRFA